MSVRFDLMCVLEGRGCYSRLGWARVAKKWLGAIRKQGVLMLSQAKQHVKLSYLLRHKTKQWQDTNQQPAPFSANINNCIISILLLILLYYAVSKCAVSMSNRPRAKIGNGPCNASPCSAKPAVQQLATGGQLRSVRVHKAFTVSHITALKEHLLPKKT